MAPAKGDSSPDKFELSSRNKLYLKISENLSKGQVKDLRALLINDHHIASGRIQKKTPIEIFSMLEADSKIGEGDLGLLKDLLRALNQARLAKEAADLERDEKRQMKKRKAPVNDGSPAKRSMGDRTRKNENMETDDFESDISCLHSKLGFKVDKLKPKGGGKTIKGSAIPLILPNDLKYNASTGGVDKIQGVQRSTIQIVPEALELLEGIEEPVSVLSSCGPCRSGKRSILSRLIGSTDAFELGHHTDPQTFGIWMGTKVLRGKDFTIVLLDTEGIDAVGATAGQDVSILVMTILLSSQLIYNSLNVPYKGDLEKMQCFLQLAEGVTVKQGGKIQRSRFQEFFPDFLWLLHDVSLKMEDKYGKEMDPTEYLKIRVLKRDEDDFEESTSDKVGRAILTFFPSVECATLERPSEKKRVKNNTPQHPNTLIPEFNKGFQNLTKWLLLKLRAKRGYDKVSTISGEALSIMTKQYLEAVNDPNSIPALNNTWKNTVEVMRGRAIDDAVKEYNKQMQSQIAVATNNGQVPLEESPETAKYLQTVTRGRGRRRARGRGRPITRNLPTSNSHPTLMDLHNKVLNEVTARFLEKIGHFDISSGEQSSENKSVVERMQNLLGQREERLVGGRKQKGSVVTGGELLHYIQQNKEHSKNFCQKLFELLLDPIRKHVESPPEDYDIKAFTRELTDALQQYEEQARGPEKCVVLKAMTTVANNLKDNLKNVKGYQIKIKSLEQEMDHLRMKLDERKAAEINWCTIL